MQVVNPLTGRKIRVGGAVFKKIVGKVSFSEQDRALLARQGYAMDTRPARTVPGQKEKKTREKGNGAVVKDSSPCKQVCEPDRVCNPVTKRCNKKKTRSVRQSARPQPFELARVRPAPAPAPAPPQPFTHSEHSTSMPFWIRNNKCQVDFVASQITVAGRPYSIHRPQLAMRSPFKRIPKQITGSCYFHAAINSMLQQTLFVKDLLTHLDKRIQSSPFARRPGESDSEANRRRFGVDDIGITARDFSPQTQDMRIMVDRARRNPDLQQWSRDVVFANMIKRACIGAKNESRQRIAHEVAAAIVLLGLKHLEGKDYTVEGASIDAANAATDRLWNLVNVGFGQGGFPPCALATVLLRCGLEVQYSGHVFARIPSTGATLVQVIPTHMPQAILLSPYPSMEQTPRLGSVSGVISVVPRDENGKALLGHAVSYVQDARKTVVIDSSDSFSSGDDVATHMKELIDRMEQKCVERHGVKPHNVKIMFCPLYAFRTPAWPFPFPPAQQVQDCHEEWH